MSSQRQSPAHVHVQFHRSDRSTQQQRRIRWQRVHRTLIPRLISHAQIRWAPVLAQLVFICSRRLWLFQPPLQYSALADLQLFIKAFFFRSFFGKRGMSEEDEHGGEGKAEGAAMCISWP